MIAVHDPPLTHSLHPTTAYPTRPLSARSIVNVARGGLLDSTAVRVALDSGRIGGLGLDVQWKEPFDASDPLARHPRVVLTPHIAGVTRLSYHTMGEIVVAEAQRVRAGLPPTICLNSPSKL